MREYLLKKTDNFSKFSELCGILIYHGLISQILAQCGFENNSLYPALEPEEQNGLGAFMADQLKGLPLSCTIPVLYSRYPGATF